jgi:hypothetical protein
MDGSRVGKECQVGKVTLPGLEASLAWRPYEVPGTAFVPLLTVTSRCAKLDSEATGMARRDFKSSARRGSLQSEVVCTALKI